MKKGGSDTSILIPPLTLTLEPQFSFSRCPSKFSSSDSNCPAVRVILKINISMGRKQKKDGCECLSFFSSLPSNFSVALGAEMNYLRDWLPTEEREHWKDISIVWIIFKCDNWVISVFKVQTISIAFIPQENNCLEVLQKKLTSLSMCVNEAIVQTFFPSFFPPNIRQMQVRLRNDPLL